LVDGGGGGRAGPGGKEAEKSPVQTYVGGRIGLRKKEGLWFSCALGKEKKGGGERLVRGGGWGRINQKEWTKGERPLK